MSLLGCRVESTARQVTCVDDEIAKFYGLLDDYDGPTSDSVAGTTGDVSVGPTTNPTNPTNPSTLTNPATDATDTNDTGDTTDTDDTGPPIVYPPFCDDIVSGPFEPIEVGQVFEPIPPPPGGSQDMASDGHGGFIARSGTGFGRLDITNAVYGVPNDVGFAIQVIDTPATLNYNSLNVRYRSNGDLVMMQGSEERIEVLRFPHNGPLGDVFDILVSGVGGFTNAAFVDTDDILWYGSYGSGDILRLDVESGDDALIANLPNVNGLVYDPLRGILFLVDLVGPSGSLYRQRISASGAPIGEIEEVVVLDGFFDGMTMDACGNVYVLDQGGVHSAASEARLHRVLMDDDGEVEDVQEIFAGLGADISHAVFAFGAPAFETSLFLVGVEGLVFYVDVQVPGAPVPVLAEAPAVLGG